MVQEKENTTTTRSGIQEEITSVEMVEAKPTPITNSLKGVAAGQDANAYKQYIEKKYL